MEADAFSESPAPPSDVSAAPDSIPPPPFAPGAFEDRIPTSAEFPFGNPEGGILANEAPPAAPEEGEELAPLEAASTPSEDGFAQGSDEPDMAGDEEAALVPESLQPLDVRPELGAGRLVERAMQARKLFVGILGGLGALGVLLIVVRLVGGGDDEAASATEEDAPVAASAVASARPASAVERSSPAELVGCVVTASSKRLHERFNRAVPPHMVAVPGSGEIAIGLGASKTMGLGLSVDPGTLATRVIYRERSTHAITGLTPVLTEDRLDFAFDSETRLPMSAARSVDGDQHFVLGVTDNGFVKASPDGQDVAILWPEHTEADITRPDVAVVPRVGFAVTFRVGGTSGPLRFGWLDEDGQRLSELRDVTLTDTLRGTPTVAANAGTVLVAVSSRASSDEPWGIALATAIEGGAPAEAKRLTVPGLPSGSDVMSPAVAPFGATRFLLQWTEGTVGARSVRAALIDAELEIVGEPVTVSPESANAGAGAVWSTGSRALSIFVQAEKGESELWGAGLECGP